MLAKLILRMKNVIGFHEKGMELIKFDRRGCMAQDWHEEDRGIVVALHSRDAYNGLKDGAQVEELEVRRKDGTKFFVFRDYTYPGRPDIQHYTDNPSESLVGKLVAL